MKILLTSFEPFGTESLNASLEVMKLVGDRAGGAEIVKLTLPVVFGQSARLLEEAVMLEMPDAVLCLGEAGGRDELTPERVAINLQDARIPDNLGQQPQDQPVNPQGPDAYFTTLPVKAMAEAIRLAGLPAHVSLSAGTYVCNQLMYSLLHLSRRNHPQIRSGFMHLPYLKEQAASKSPPVTGFEAADMARGV